MVYRKGQDVLIDHLIHEHPRQELVEQSRIPDGYEKTNIWNIYSDPEEKYSSRLSIGLAKRVVQYYSFCNDVVLDPFAGIGITARAAAEQNRRFCMMESRPELADYMADDLRMRGSSFIHPFEFTFSDLRKEDDHAANGI
jgi:DNA modification methylase